MGKYKAGSMLLSPPDMSRGLPCSQITGMTLFSLPLVPSFPATLCKWTCVGCEAWCKGGMVILKGIQLLLNVSG